MQEIIRRYESYFDDCRPLEYKGLTIYPFLTKDIRICNMACHCLLADPVDFEDITLMPLERLELILTIIDRMMRGQLPEQVEKRAQYYTLVQSFQLLMRSAFRDFEYDFKDPQNENRKIVLQLMEKQSQQYTVLGKAEFEELADLILYHNGIDVAYKKYPPAMRRELEKKLKAMQRQSAKEAPTIEKMIDSAFLFLKSYDAVMNLPLRKFYHLISNIQKREEYTILMSGMYITKNVSHWMSGGYEYDPYQKLVTTADLENQFQNL